ncbi:MAG TPA: glycosyltransferase [Epsilonproteobacteria bacterium]|nr:glycosyltransferase [Campylobacterota bacterium]
MKIIILTPSLYKNDGVGNDVMHEYELLSAKYDICIYAEYYNEDLLIDANIELITLEKLKKYSKNSKNTIIFHHSIYWELVEDILIESKAKIYFRYHNITPPEFFAKYNKLFVDATRKGLVQTKRIIKSANIHKFISDSSFNNDDLIGYGADPERCFTIAPFHKISDFDNEPFDISLLDELIDGKINILFVGRFAPNKGHKHIVEVAYEYKTLYGSNIRFSMIGKIDQNLKQYYDEVMALVEQYDLHDIVSVEDNVSFRQLHTYYGCSHVFLLTSEHEGFCVPILEAQAHDLPIVALDRSAVASTLGENQVIFNEINHRKIATSLNVISKNVRYREYLATNGRNNLKRFALDNLENEFINLLELA